MDLLDLVRDLTWSSHGAAADDLQYAYEGILADRFGTFLGCLFKDNPPAAKDLVTLYEQLPREAFRRFLRAPQTSHQLLWNTPRLPSDIQRYVRNALLAESHRAGIVAAVEEECWTATGDYVALPATPNGAVVQPLILAELALDFGSPSARQVRTPWETNPAPTDGAGSTASRRGRDSQLLAPADRKRALKLLRGALDGIKATSLASYSFVVNNNFSVVVLRSPRLKFSSSSPEKFIGATILWMGQDGDEDCVDFADALIHEAVHSVLDMHEFLAGRGGGGTRPWFSDPLLYDGRDRTVSPWTNNPLALLTFVHACFVWFALVQFWARAIPVGWFARDRCLERLAKSAAGFLQGPVSAQLQPFADVIDAELLECVRLMEHTIKDGLAAGGT